MNHTQIEPSFQNFYSDGKFAHANLPYQDSQSSFQPDCKTYLDEEKLQDFDLVQQKESDQNFIDSFVQNIQKQKKEKSDHNFVKIYEAKALLKEIIKEKDNLKKDSDLDINDNCFDSKLKAISKRVNEVSKKIQEFDKQVKPFIILKLQKRLKKRQAIKRKKLKYKIFKEETQKQIQEQHKIIDELLNERAKEVNIAKREEALKRQADSVLLEVRKKKNEAKKMLNMLTALTKLRELRSKQEEEEGGYCSKQLTETFNQVMTHFQKLWTRQMEVYKLEEKGLRIMLEENSLPIIQDSKVQLNLLQWEKALFGNVSCDENEKLMTAAENNIQALIQIRGDWDKFITNETTAMASSIPLGWVLPPSSQNEEWKMFLAQEKN